jgi:hypothetical protein
MFEEQVALTLDGLDLAEAVHDGALTVFPLLGADKPGPRYLTLDEALAKNLAEITEISAEGRVPELFFENKGDDPILLVDGEQLIGAKQNRVLNLTILVRPKSRITIPVSCVEQGRWSSSRSNFTSADHAMFATAKAHKAEQVSASMRATGKRASDQSAVWRDIEARLHSLRAAAPTRAMSAAYEQNREHVEKAVTAIRPQEGQRGAVYLVNGKLAGIEVFDKAATYAKLAPKLARSYALDAVAPGDTRKVDPLAVSLTLARLKTLKVESYPGTDLGTDLRLADEALNGAALVAGEAVLHLEAFAKN